MANTIKSCTKRSKHNLWCCSCYINSFCSSNHNSCYNNNISTSAVVAQGRAPNKGDMGARPICGIYGIWCIVYTKPSHSLLNLIKIDRLVMDFMNVSQVMQSYGIIIMVMVKFMIILMIIGFTMIIRPLS